MQPTVLIVTLVLMAVLALAFLLTVRASAGTGEPGDPEPRRKVLIWFLVVAGVVITVASLRPWPHAVALGDQVIEVNATGSQWSWEIDNVEIPVGRPVVFNVHTRDVNHGFGVADPDGRLLVQIQAMPGYVNQVAYVFDEPGVYRVMCLEYCGLAHHVMHTEFQVVAN